jgi:hypothetical protein
LASYQEDEPELQGSMCRAVRSHCVLKEIESGQRELNWVMQYEDHNLEKNSLFFSAVVVFAPSTLTFAENISAIWKTKPPHRINQSKRFLCGDKVAK